MTKLVRLATVIISVALLAACMETPAGIGSQPVSKAQPASQMELESNTGQQAVIGMLVSNLTSDSNLALVDAATQKADILGLELQIYNGINDPQIQISQVKKLVGENINGILLLAQDPASIQGEVELAIQAGVPVVSLGSKIESDAITSFVGAPEELSGEMAMGFIANLLEGKGQIVILEGASGQSAHVERRRGIQNILDTHRGIRVVSAKNGNWSTSTAMTLMERWLQAFDQIDAVVAENDDMALGARQVIEQNGLDIPVVGIDGTQKGLEAVANNRLAATVFQNGPKQAEIAVEVLFSAIEKQEIQKEYRTDCILVEKGNIGNYWF